MSLIAGLPPPPDEEEQVDEDYDDNVRGWSADVLEVPNWCPLDWQQSHQRHLYDYSKSKAYLRFHYNLIFIPISHKVPRSLLSVLKKYH